MGKFSVKALINHLTTPRRFAGGLIPSILGYHVFRIAFYQLRFFLRRRRKISDPKVQAIRDAFNENGVLAIPNFFSEEIYNEIKNECYRLKMDVYNERAPRMLVGITLPGENKPSALLRKHLGENEIINQVVSNVLRKDILINPGIEFSRSSFAEEDFNKESTETADKLHFDVSFPTIKCFYYINKVEESNAAFCFVKKSQKMTLSRLLMEYWMSIDFAGWSKDKKANVTPEVPEEYLKEHDMKVESIVGEPNTLVIANTMGFHRRGDFSSTNPREIVFVNFRGLDTLAYLKKSLSKRS